MNISDITFDNFLSCDLNIQKAIFEDYDLLKELVKKNISIKRYEHSISVANVAKDLAKAHGVDDKKAYLAGLLHDVCKFPDEKTSGVLEMYLKKYDPKKLNGCIGAYHSWVAPYYLKEKTNLNDKEILDAIYNHTILENKTPLNMIIYIADKREPLRNINDDILDISFKDLNKGYQELAINVEQYLKSHGEKPFKIMH